MNERFEYYWENGRVVEYTNHRNGSRGRFRNPPSDPGKLIATIQRLNRRNSVEFGPQQTPERLGEAMLRYSRYDCDPNVSDIGPNVPNELRDRIRSHVAGVTKTVTAQWEAAGNEEGQSGLFSGVMNTAEAFRYGEWEATVRVQVFSPQVKEPKVGADIGIIVDLRRGRDRVVKGTLVQAKRTEKVPVNPMGLQDLAGQVAVMQKTTKESYGMIYSNSETYLFDPGDPGKQIAAEQFFDDQILCVRGDRSMQAVAQAYDHSIVIDVTVATGVSV